MFFSGCTCTSLGKQNTGKCSSGLGQNSGGNSGNSWKKINSALQRKRQDSVLKIGTSICNLYLVISEWLLCLGFRSLGGRNSLSWFEKISDETSWNSRKKINPTESNKIIKKIGISICICVQFWANRSLCPPYRDGTVCVWQSLFWNEWEWILVVMKRRAAFNIIKDLINISLRSNVVMYVKRHKFLCPEIWIWEAFCIPIELVIPIRD